MNAGSHSIRDVRTSLMAQLMKYYAAGEANSLLNNLLTYVLNLPLYKILSEPELIISQEKYQKTLMILNELIQYKPVQYITGAVDFCGLPMKVDQRVLIPRPETEELCEICCNKLEGQHEHRLKILDIGTGSGCLAIALKKRFPGFSVSGLDTSAEALGLAAENADNNQVEINWICEDFLDTAIQGRLNIFDVIISNPPYIPESMKSAMERNVTEYEPPMALFVPEKDPLCFYRAIRGFCNDHLHPGGFVFLETYELNHQEVQELFEKEIFDHYHEIHDFRGKERFVIVRKINRGGHSEYGL